MIIKKSCYHAEIRHDNMILTGIVHAFPYRFGFDGFKAVENRFSHTSKFKLTLFLLVFAS